jgi:proteasome lid subunit RPN8/RPN11
MERRVICGPAARAAILADLAARPQIEACGLLLGTLSDDAWRIEEAVPLRNTDNAAASFEFDPEELLRGDLEYGARIVGVYHSHPGGPAYPSRKDQRNMRAHAESPWVWMIVTAPSHDRSGIGAAPAARRGGAEAGEPDAAERGAANWSALKAGAFQVDDAGTLLVYPVEA